MRWQNPPKERRNILSKEIRELINEGLILPPETYKLPLSTPTYRLPRTLISCTLNVKGTTNESIRDEEELSDNDICL